VASWQQPTETRLNHERHLAQAHREKEMKVKRQEREEMKNSLACGSKHVPN